MATIENEFVKNVHDNDDEYETTVESYEKWEQYNLKDDLIKGIYGMGFEKPSFIQKTAVKPIVDGRDIRAQAQSGTGKTGAFAVGALQVVKEDFPHTQVLILVSTREIAAQNAARIKELGKFMTVDVVLLSGGTSVSTDIQRLSKNPQIVVGTPGRVEQMIAGGHLKTDQIKLLIIDEADEMLQAGFQDQVKAIFKSLDKKLLQIAMFSATYEEEELRVSEEILRDPVIIDLRYSDQTLSGIKQFYINMGPEPAFKKNDLTPKLGALVDLFKRHKLGQAVVFVTAKERAKFIYSGLISEDIPCELMTADLPQSERETVLNRFRSGENRILVSSGLLSRGIDIQNLGVVFCLDVPPPSNKATYIHRIGRSGRYGRKGKAVLILYHHEVNNLREIEKFYNTKVRELQTDDLVEEK